MTNKHKHADVIKAWADGAEIEYRSISGRWLPASTPNWCVDCDYRVKPKPPIHRALKEAHAKGAVIQYYNRDDGVWTDTCANIPSWREDTQYRVKPKLYKLELELTEAEAFVLACKINNAYISQAHAPIPMVEYAPHGKILARGRDLYRKFDFEAMAAAFK